MENIKRLYIKNLSNKPANKLLKKYQIDCLDELSRHSNYKTKLAKQFIGYNELPGQVNAYLRSENNFPLILHGNSGSGKTSLIAYITEKVSFFQHYCSFFSGYLLKVVTH